MKNELSLSDLKTVNTEERFDVLDTVELSKVVGSGGIYYDEDEDAE